MSKEQRSESAVSGSQFIKKEEEMEEEKEAPKRVSRRQFVKGAAVGGAGVAAAGMLASCGPAPVPTTAPGETAAPAPTCPPAGECPPCPVAGVPETWDQETDVVVVGSGFGKCAAIEAARAGAEVLVLEKGSWIGGLQLSGGDSMTMGGNNVFQQSLGVEDTDLEDWYEAERASCEYRSPAEITRVLVERGAETVQWCMDLGLEYEQTNGTLYGVSPIKRGMNLAPSPNYLGKEPLPDGELKDGGIGVHQMFQKEVDRLGVPTLLNHRMTSIYREPDGPVLGVEVNTPEGTINIKARKAVVLATGGWTDNYRMVQAWDPRAVGPDCYGDGGTPCDGTMYVDSSGDGHLAAAQIGAGFADMSTVAGYNLFYGARSYWGWDPPDNWTTFNGSQPGHGIDPRGDPSFYERVIVVKGNGARWINEIHGGQEPEPQGPGIRPQVGDQRSNLNWPFPAAFLSIPQPRNVWAIGDADAAAALEWPLEEIQNPNPKTYHMFDPACLAIADTLAELADKMGIPAAAIEETVSRYNGFVDAGKDDDFEKPMPMYKIATPPFYGLKCSLVRHTCRNGLRVNTKSQVLEQSDQIGGNSGRSVDGSISIDDEKTIPHLYAGGEIGNIIGWRGPHNTVGHYITACRIAGENAVKETAWE